MDYSVNSQSNLPLQRSMAHTKTTVDTATPSNTVVSIPSNEWITMYQFSRKVNYSSIPHPRILADALNSRQTTHQNQ